MIFLKRVIVGLVLLTVGIRLQAFGQEGISVVALSWMLLICGVLLMTAGLLRAIRE
jgi:hypothetical protein